MSTLTQAQLDAVYKIIIRTIRHAIHRLYHLPIKVLAEDEPTMEDIANGCKMVLELAESAELDSDFTDPIEVIGQAAQAIRDGNEKGLVDCAYHLEDLLDRINR